MKIMLIGMPGCGKTTIGKKASKELGLHFIDLDNEIVNIESKSINQIFSEFGEDYFRELETKSLLKSLEHDNVLISSGGGIIKNKLNIFSAKKKNCYVIFIDRPLDLIINDVDTTTRPLLKEGADRLKALYAERYEIYKTAADVTLKNDSDIKVIVDKVKKISIEHEKRE